MTTSRKPQSGRPSASGRGERPEGRRAADKPREGGYRSDKPREGGYRSGPGRASGPGSTGRGASFERDRDRGGRPHDDQIVVCGIHPVEEFLRARPKSVRTIVLDTRTPPGAVQAAREAASLGITIREAGPGEFEELVGSANAQGIAAILRNLDTVDGDELVDVVAAEGEGVLIALDLVQDPQNFGSILRTAAFFGAAGIIIPKDRSVRLTSSAVRASAGGAARVPVGEVTNLARTLQRCVSMGMNVAGTVVDGGVPPDRLPKTGPRVIVMGSEGEGLRRLVRESCSMLVTIPSPGGFESLNVGVAAGIMLCASVGPRVVPDGQVENEA